MKRKFKKEEIEHLNIGRIYYNPNDLNIFVKRKGLFSWTMNLANKWTWLIVFIELTLLVIVVSILT